MTYILPWLAADLLMLAIILVFLIFLAAGVIWTVGWYLHTWLAFAGCVFLRRVRRDPMAVAHGDVPHVPEKAKRRAA